MVNSLANTMEVQLWPIIFVGETSIVIAMNFAEYTGTAASTPHSINSRNNDLASPLPASMYGSSIIDSTTAFT